MSEISKSYEPAEVENYWYQQWLDNGCFRGEADPAKEPFCITIPPPNVTGVLHMGHLLNNTIQDLYTRRARQQGKAAVWVPGTDHAGIATQNRVERKLRESGQTRHDLGREKFVEVASEWRDEHRNIILDQLKKLGASCDWERTVHTLDPQYSRGVLTAFVELFHKGNIYRGKRMVNWCPVSLTALSDEEVIMKPQSGKFYKMRYEIAERPGEFVEISTTRPETIMGDTGVAIHPEDDRYKHLHGLHAVRPFPKAHIPFVCDEHVDREFGTGVLKVTPAHDRADFDIGNRHGLEVIDVLTPDGKVNCPECPELHGKDRFVARKIAAKMLDELGLLLKEEPYENNVGFSERADVPIEPRLSDQWWLKYPKVEEAKEVVRNGTIKFYPERWSKTYLHWLENIQDWCISRQLWWGHRIPVWYKKGIDRATLTEADLRDPAKVHVSVDGPSDPENWDQEEDVLDTWASSWLWPFGVFGWPNLEVGDCVSLLKDFGKIKAGSEGYVSSSVISSGKISISFGENEVVQIPLQELELVYKYKDGINLDDELNFYKHSSKELDFWYPTSLLATGFDIIFFWVARMIMAGLEFMGDVPFKAVYFNGLIRDEKGRKMSKSLGNSPDPLELIGKFGADGLRLGLLLIAPKGQDILFSEDRIKEGRNFCNKLWNACRFRLMQDEGRDAPTGRPLDASKNLDSLVSQLDASLFDVDDHAILGKLSQTLDTVDKALETYELHAAVQALYTFFWADFCDWYVEVSKAKLDDARTRANCLAIQDICLRQLLLMLHPIIPFITEELWHSLGFAEGSAHPLDAHADPAGQRYLNVAFDTIQSHNPDTGVALREKLAGVGVTLDDKAVAATNALRDFVTQARAVKAQYNLAAKRDVTFHLEADEAQKTLLAGNRDKLLKLVGAQAIQADGALENAPAVVTPLGTLYLDLAGSVDTEAEKAKLTKELEQLEKAIKGAQAKLGNESFTGKAPANVVEGVKQTLAANLEKQAETQKLLASLG